MLSTTEKEIFITQQINDEQRRSRKQETRAEYLWRILRLTLRNTVGAVLTTEKTVQKVVHGISHMRSISPNLANKIGIVLDVSLNPINRVSDYFNSNFQC